MPEAGLIDCHLHILDPARFPYHPQAPYHPEGAEVGTLAQLRAVFAAHGVERALLVQPTSGYFTDNSALLEAIAQSGGLWRGIAMVSPDMSSEDLAVLKAQGVAGVACMMAMGPVDVPAWCAMASRLADLDMVLDIQFAGEGIFDALPIIAASPAQVVIDHCGRPDLDAGLDAPAFRALLGLAARERTAIKISGQHKFAPFPWPFEAADPFIGALIAAFGPERCVWGSDWPFLRVPERVDYGPLRPLVERYFPDETARRQVLRDTALQLFWGNSQL
ncbi:amidohydrolase family protein [Thioclava sp. GXIMD2076]|uniref:Amidohydrolase family protein n=1 Tax=Thioclava kandeliae TaxID=3070818 RepID=A0ABV1SN99_9RHOB